MSQFSLNCMILTWHRITDDHNLNMHHSENNTFITADSSMILYVHKLGLN